MTTHAAEPYCQIKALMAHVALHDGMPVDQYLGDGCGELAAYVVQVRRSAGVCAMYEAAICLGHLDLAHHLDGYQGVEHLTRT